MLWSLTKILIFVAIIALLTIGAGYLMESQGGVQVTLGGTEYTFDPLESVVVGLILVAALWLIFKVLSFLLAVARFLSGDETALSRFFARNRERKGFQALSEGMMALASGEGRLAMSKSAKAEKYLQKPELTNLLTAQAAEMTGDTKKAAETYKKLIANDATRFVGIRGIMKQKLTEGDADTARKLAEKALTLKPRHVETQDVLLKLQTQAEDWSGARGTLNAKLKFGSLPRDVYNRREAVLALSEATKILDEDASVESREKAIEANRISPDLVPAAAMAARSYIEKGRPKNAVRILKKAWSAQPHPDLAAAFAEIEPGESPQDRVKRFSTLAKLQPDHPETRLVMAELNIVAEDYPEARRLLAPLIEEQPDARALTLMAAIERGEGASDSVVQGWLARALNAPRGPQWVCDNCHHIHASWRPVCENCNSFDTLSWTTPETTELASATGVHMLPLIVGTKADGEPESEDFVEAEFVDMPAPDQEAETPDEPETLPQNADEQSKPEPVN